MPHVALVAMSVWIGSSPRFAGFSRWKIFVSACLGVPSFSGAVGVFAARCRYSLHPKAALELDDIGITDNASAVGAGHLRWAEIDHLVLYRFLGQPLLGIVPVNLSQIARSGKDSSARPLAGVESLPWAAPVQHSTERSPH